MLTYQDLITLSNTWYTKALISTTVLFNPSGEKLLKTSSFKRKIMKHYSAISFHCYRFYHKTFITRRLTRVSLLSRVWKLRSLLFIWYKGSVLYHGITISLGKQQ